MGHVGEAPELLETQVHVWNHLFNYIHSLSLKCAVELGIPDAIHELGGRPATLAQLVEALGIPTTKAVFLRRLMRLLTHSGFFSVQADGDGQEAYLLTKSSERLLRDDPCNLLPFVRGFFEPPMLSPCLSLSAWFRGSSPTAFHHVHGASIWELASRMPDLNEKVNLGMTCDSRLTMKVAIREHGSVFQQLRSLVDVGGGNGAAAIALAEAFPQLKCSVLDLPHVVATSPKDTAVDFVAGDMFEYIPPADAVLLKWILHDWGDERCVKLLKLCKKAIPPKEEGGKVIIIDMVLDAEDARGQEVLRETQYLFDVMMMAIFEGGKERTEEEWRKIFADAGFSGHKITNRGMGCRAIIELYP